MPVYSFTMQSKELKGSTRPNIIVIALASDDDAALFKGNLEKVFAARVVTYNKILSQNYDLPYPAGTNRQARFAMWSSPETGREAQARIRNVSSSTNLNTLAAALIAAGIKLPNTALDDAVAINAYDISPGGSA